MIQSLVGFVVVFSYGRFFFSTVAEREGGDGHLQVRGVRTRLSVEERSRPAQASPHGGEIACLLCLREEVHHKAGAPAPRRRAHGREAVPVRNVRKQVRRTYGHLRQLSIWAECRLTAALFCPFRFTQPANLRTHMKKKHDSSHGIRNNKCPHCQETFQSIIAVHQHILEDHPDVVAEEREAQTLEKMKKEQEKADRERRREENRRKRIERRKEKMDYHDFR